MSVREFRLAGASIRVFADVVSAESAVADLVAQVVERSRAERGRAVLGLPTGSTPLGVYDRLVESHRAGRLSLDDVSTYNLDEYYPIDPFDRNSYRNYMQARFFGRVGLPANRAHVLDGTVPADFADGHAREYDRWIEAEGGLDLQLLGVGRNGHIGFNEPSNRTVAEFAALPSRLVPLHPTTREDAVRDFGSLEAVPTHALTLGPAAILAARLVIVMAFGARKAEIVARSLLGPVGADVPATLLRTRGDGVIWILDGPAAAGLERD